MKPYPNRLASGNRITATTILGRSITDQIEAVILSSPECSPAASQRVDGYLVLLESFRGQG